MATAFDKVWNGSTSALWELAANWTPAVIPAASERVLIPAGTQSIDATGANDKALTSLYIAPGYTGNIGASGTRLTMSAVDLVHKGSGKIWLTEGAGTTTNVVIDAPGNNDAIDISGSLTNFYLIRGTATLAGSGSYTLIVVGHRNSQAGDATLTISGSGGTQTRVLQYGGRITNGSIVTTLDQLAGEFIQQVGTAITTANVGGGGTARLQYESNSTMTTARTLAGGTLDVAKNRNAVVTVTSLFQFPGSVLIEDPQLLTVTNRFDWR